MAKAIMMSDLAGHWGRPPVFQDCSLIDAELMKKGYPVTTRMIVSGSRKSACPINSMTLCSHRGNRLFTMSMRMCSLARSVHGEHNKNTALNSTHCSSSQAFDEVSKILRTVALTAETITAAKISQARRLPIHVLIASMTRDGASNTLSTASRAPTDLSPSGRPTNAVSRTVIFVFHPPRDPALRGQVDHFNPMQPPAVNGEDDGVRS